MKVHVPNPPWVGHDARRQTWALGRSGYIQARGLIYLSGADLEEVSRSDMVRRQGSIGIITVVSGRGTPSTAIEIEMRESDMADFCRQFIEQYEQKYVDKGANDE